MSEVRLIESDDFEFEFLSRLAERESWRKEVHRPIYHLHKWWAKRLGSVFRGILLGSILPRDASLSGNFYSSHDFSEIVVFDPFCGSGTTVGEAHKLGMTALGRDINPVAVEAVRVALGPMDKERIDRELEKLSQGIGARILALYRSKDGSGSPCDVLYYFWVRQVGCPACARPVDLFSSWTIARNAYPNRKPEVQVLCPMCGLIFPSTNGKPAEQCPSCDAAFDPDSGNANGSRATCPSCHQDFPILPAVNRDEAPRFRLYGKLVLTSDGRKEYLKATDQDLADFEDASRRLNEELRNGSIVLPDLSLEAGYNTKQAMSYGFRSWRQFFNDRQLLGLGWLHRSISQISDEQVRDLFLLSFSGALEFNNMFASYKGEGTGAVRHMFSHHILKPERMPIESNLWGTPKSSGSFSTLFRSRVNRAIKYRQRPTEVNGTNGAEGLVCSPPFTGRVEKEWPVREIPTRRGVFLSSGDSAATGLPAASVDLVVTDPPFFDNVHYSELADFFYAWQQLTPRGFINGKESTRSPKEVQDSDAIHFANKLQAIFQECHRVLKDDGLLLFTYHHSRDEGWQSVASAILNSGFSVVNAQPIKSEMSVATPKAQAKEPIQIDMIIACRKATTSMPDPLSREGALSAAKAKIERLERSGFNLSINDKKVITYGQLLASLRSPDDNALLASIFEDKPARLNTPGRSPSKTTRIKRSSHER